MFESNKDFYPTPIDMINKMLSNIDFRIIQSVLEPSAGAGHIVQAIEDKFKYNSYSSNKKKYDIDCVEYDENLQHILKGKNYRVVHNDFLTYNTYKKYDLICLNPPFLNGEKHLLKAIQMQQEGGQIVCLLNAETLRNPYSNSRKELINKLDQYNAEVEFIENAFTDAERKTNVEIALIKINIPKISYNSDILVALEQQEQFREEHENEYNQLINNDFIKGIVEQFNFEVKAGLKLIAEYNALKPFMLSSLDSKSDNTILKLELHYKDDSSTLENSYIKQTRSKYWKALFESPQFMGLFTSNLRQKYHNRINELADYDFSLYNIYTIRIELSKEMTQSVEDTILNLFEEFSNKHHWYDEMSKNIHLYNGWKTNKAHKINKKIIIPLNGFDRWGEGRPEYHWHVKDKLSDIEKVFNYLSNGIDEHIDLDETLKVAAHYQETKKIELKYFYVTFYKKGTCHIEFKNMELLHKFNLFGSQRKNWLPPNYGKTEYKDMTAEEKATINEFEGKESYNKVMKDKNYYLVETSKLLMLA